MKKTVLLSLAITLTYLSHAQTQTPFNYLKSSIGYNKALEFNMNTNGIQSYRFISNNQTFAGSSVLNFQLKEKNKWSTSVTFSGNRMGIGTQYPQQILDINGTAQTDKLIINPPNGGNFLQMGQNVGSNQRLFNFGSSNTFAGYSFYNTDGTLRMDFSTDATQTYLGMRDENGSEIFKAAKSPNVGSFIHLPQANSRMVIGDFGSYLLNEGHKLVIKNGSAKIEGNLIANGNVGIGTNNPDAKLTVNGKIHAKEVKVDLNIPADYVFEKYYEGQSNLKEDYTMPTLKEVEVFTKKNHHLPAIPSAKEIKENGLNVSEMTNLLLQKIEELTLYTIEQQKRIEKLETKLIQKK